MPTRPRPLLAAALASSPLTALVLLLPGAVAAASLPKLSLSVSSSAIAALARRSPAP